MDANIAQQSKSDFQILLSSNFFMKIIWIFSTIWECFCILLTSHKQGNKNFLKNSMNPILQFYLQINTELCFNQTVVSNILTKLN